MSEKGHCRDRMEMAGSRDPLLSLSSLRNTHNHPVGCSALSSPLPGELLHFQLQAVDLVSEVLLEEPVVQFSRLAASLGLAQSGCEPHELVIKNKSHGGRKTKFTAQHKTTQGRRHGETEDKKFCRTQGKKLWGKKMEKKQILKKSKMKVNQAGEK